MCKRDNIEINPPGSLLPVLESDPEDLNGIFDSAADATSP